MDSQVSPEIVRKRVPVASRIAPAAAFALTNLGGILAAWWTIRLFSELRNDTSTTVKGLMDSIGSICQTVGLIYIVAALIGMVSLVVIWMRSDEDEAELPGITYLLLLPAFASPILSAYAQNMIIEAFHTTAKINFGELGGAIAQNMVISIIVGIAGLITILLFTFLPFSPRVGKRMSAMIALGLTTAAIAALTATSFWLVAFSQVPTTPLAPR